MTISYKINCEKEWFFHISKNKNEPWKLQVTVSRYKVHGRLLLSRRVDKIAEVLRVLA